MALSHCGSSASTSSTTIPALPHHDRRAKASKETSTELRGRLRYAVYDDAIRRQLFREKRLKNIMGAALQNRDFQVYLQPKYRTESETIGGARGAGPLDGRRRHDLSRRVHPAVRKERIHHQLDLWVFEELCLRIRRGSTPAAPGKSTGELLPRATQIPFSWSAISKSARGGGTPPQYIEIELTENVVFEDVGKLSKSIDAIHAAGFGCAMDEFGSGYSSLNLTQNIPPPARSFEYAFHQQVQHRHAQQYSPTTANSIACPARRRCGTSYTIQSSSRKKAGRSRTISTGS